jgi:hypothetical protein
MPPVRCRSREEPLGVGCGYPEVTRRSPPVVSPHAVHHCLQNGFRLSDSASARVMPMSCSILSSSMASFARSLLRPRHSRKSAAARSTARPTCSLEPLADRWKRFVSCSLSYEI